MPTYACPFCGNKESVLQLVTTDEWECRRELDGCGATFEQPQEECAPCHPSIEAVISAMADAIRNFEHRDHPLGQSSLLDIECRTAELLDVLKSEIGRLSTLLQPEP